MEKQHHSEPESMGSVMERWFKRFELIAEGDIDDGYYLTEGQKYPVAHVDVDGKQLAVNNDEGFLEWFAFDEVPDYFEIRIREA